MITVGAFEAKSQLQSLLERVAEGEEVLITNHGKPCALLIPVSATDDLIVAQAITKLKNVRKNCTLGNLVWQELRDEGRQ